MLAAILLLSCSGLAWRRISAKIRPLWLALRSRCTPASPRHHTHMLPCVLACRAVPQEGATFSDMARQAGRALMDALAHSALPLQQVLEVAAVHRQPGVNPLFQVRL
jgi:hypothetical protein